ncbi:FIST N-terminal domain-containing protein [Accumulibacter sp.]|uniref:FIST signal transduction protein n=1 Tax=Accumulibacter sp. TaxID=2053492 RepID=UPI0026012783|nr:FIST N-terminal domain-containing protein [Accumulibacter sp.]MCM8610660.1 FIST C-terminal domain-containing protein [Accumulibacter sp.]MCM8634653.1 FIST C-terminal domain-containing protein [Accumulibacter sp.]MCM8641917.1 FIST C-terminal domain-containing protein [Accumulibacter sp.]
MLEFFSASTRMANPQRAIVECLEVALGEAHHDCDLVIINASIGHQLGDLIGQARAQCPHARIVAGSCAGVIGREGVSESMKDVALMAIRGRDFAVAHVDGLNGHNSREKAVALATALKRAAPAINMVYLIVTGIDVAADQIIAGFDAIFGAEVSLFGATSGDNNRGLVTFQAVDERVFERAAIAVGFCDATLEVDTHATHGFVATGEPLIVTRSDGHLIHELNGRPAAAEYLDRLKLPMTASLADSGPIGALAERLTAVQAQAYGNEHVLRAVFRWDAAGTLYYPVTCPEGTALWLTLRDEERIFSDLDRMLAVMSRHARGRKPVAMFQADCGARGRLLFNRVLKEELIQRLQHPFSTDFQPPPWLGMYGFGEFARLDGINHFHNYTSALAAIYRREAT